MRRSFLLASLPLLGLLSSAGPAQAEAGWRLDVDPDDALTRSELEAALGAGTRRCLATPRFDAKANGFGELTVLVDRAGEVREVRYLGFDAPVAAERGFAGADLARRQRATFDDLGACLVASARGVRIGSVSRSAPASAVVWFLPPGR